MSGMFTVPLNSTLFIGTLGRDSELHAAVSEGRISAPNVHPDAYLRFLKEIVMLREADKRNGVTSMSLGVVDEVLAFGRGETPSTCFLSNNCHKFLSINRQGQIFLTCTDALNICVGNLDFPGLSQVIERSTLKPSSSVQRCLGNRRTGSVPSFGPGCPKYSEGPGDIYLSLLHELVNWYRNLLTASKVLAFVHETAESFG